MSQPPIPLVSPEESDRTDASARSSRKQQALWIFLVAAAICASVSTAADILLSHVMHELYGKHLPPDER